MQSSEKWGINFSKTLHSQASETTDSPAAMTSLQEICISTEKDNADQKNSWCLISYCKNFISFSFLSSFIILRHNNISHWKSVISADVFFHKHTTFKNVLTKNSDGVLSWKSARSYSRDKVRSLTHRYPVPVPVVQFLIYQPSYKSLW